MRWQLHGALLSTDAERPRQYLDRHPHRQSARRLRHPRLHGVGATADGAAAGAARRRSRHSLRQCAHLHRQRLPLLRRHHGGVRTADGHSQTVRDVTDHCLRPLRRVSRHSNRLRASSVHRLAPEGSLLP